MLAQEERLKKADFERFFHSGTRYHSRLLQLIYTPHPTFHGSVVVPKKVARAAVTRNRTRRVLYDALRRYGRAHPGVYIVILKTAAQSVPPHTLREDLRALLGGTVHSR